MASDQSHIAFMVAQAVLIVLFCYRNCVAGELPIQRTAVTCFQHPGQSKPLVLNCSDDNSRLIQVTGISHGSSLQLVNTKVNHAYDDDVSMCDWLSSAVAGDTWFPPFNTTCQDTDPNIDFVLDRCSSTSTCSVDTAEMPQDFYSCNRHTTDFLLVTYTCLPNESKLVNSVCGDRNLSGNDANGITYGYLTSPGYPGRYGSNTACTCTLTVDNPKSSQISLKLLDFQLSPLPNDYNPADWVEFSKLSVTHQAWASGQRLAGSSSVTAMAAARRGQNEYIRTSSSTILINFESDDAYEARGFWLIYKGETLDGLMDVPVNISCQVYVSPAVRSSSTCLDPLGTGELFLSCRSFGTIDILLAYSGSTPINDDNDTTSSTCDVAPSQASHATSDGSRICLEVDSDIDDVLGACMAMSVCLPLVHSKVLASCEAPSSYFRIDYRCIAPGDRVDVCGLRTRDVMASIGYISSSNYPSLYSPDIDCCCHLATERRDSQVSVVFYALDLAISFPGDWLQYNTVVSLGGFSNNFVTFDSNSTVTDEPIYTGASQLGLHFHADSDFEGRGFWIQFVGRSLDGANVPVHVTCSADCQLDVDGSTADSNKPTFPYHVTGTSGPTKPAFISQEENQELNRKRQVVIIGVTLAAATIFVVIMLAVFICIQRRRRSVDTLSVTTPSEIASTDTVPFVKSLQHAPCDVSHHIGGAPEIRKELILSVVAEAALDLSNQDAATVELFNAHVHVDKKPSELNNKPQRMTSNDGFQTGLDSG